MGSGEGGGVRRGGVWLVSALQKGGLPMTSPLPLPVGLVPMVGVDGGGVGGVGGEDRRGVVGECALQSWGGGGWGRHLKLM